MLRESEARELKETQYKTETRQWTWYEKREKCEPCCTRHRIEPHQSCQSKELKRWW